MMNYMISFCSQLFTSCIVNQPSDHVMDITVVQVIRETGAGRRQEKEV